MIPLALLDIDFSAIPRGILIALVAVSLAVVVAAVVVAIVALQRDRTEAGDEPPEEESETTK